MRAAASSSWLAAVALAACGGGASSDPDARAGSIDGTLPIDAPPLASPFPATITIAASQGSIANPFAVDQAGAGAAPLGPIAISADAGTINLGDGPAASFLYMTVPFSGYTLYQGLAVTPGRWDVFWTYCQAGALTFVFDEGIDGPPLFDTLASGSCAGTATTTTTQVALPALSMPAPTPSGGYTVDGTDVVVHADGTGALTIGGRTLPLIVFGDVDCSTRCGSPGWYELHSVVWDDAQQRVIFVIVYLILGSSGHVQLAYARSLPDLGDPIGSITLPATWSANASLRSAARPGPRFGVPPPSLR